MKIALLLSLVVFLSSPLGQIRAEAIDPNTTGEAGDATATVPREDKPIALVASQSGAADLVAWCTRNVASLTGKTFIVPSDLASKLLQWNPATWDLSFQELSGSRAAFDILLAEQILSDQVSKVIVFKDPSANENLPDMSLLVRACQVANVPIAVNEATANLVMRRATRMAYLIFNPVTGQGNAEEELELIYGTLEPQIALTVVMTKPDVDPAEQAKELVEIIKARPASADSMSTMILASGGDGTVSAVAGAIMGTGIPFGVIPRGTANAFSVALGIPTDTEAACKNILHGHLRVVDGALCNNIPMILIAGIGFEAGMVDNAPREAKDVLGPLAYVLGALKQFFMQEPFKCDLEIDGTKSSLMVGAITVAVAAPPTSVLAQGFGEVVPDDGLLDVTVGTATDMIQGLDSLADLLRSAVVKTPTTSESLLCFRAKEIRVSCDPKQKIVIDGEMVAMDPITFTTLPSALNVIVPQSQ